MSIEKKIELIVKELLLCLSTKQKDVVIAYYGLDNKGVQTLATIGQKKGLSRERIRQIKKSALDTLKFSCREKNFLQFIVFLEKIIVKQGGIIAEEELFKKLFKDSYGYQQIFGLRLIIDSSERLGRTIKNKKIGSLVYLEAKKWLLSVVDDLNIFLIKYFQKNEEVVSSVKLDNIVVRHCRKNENENITTVKFRDVLIASRVLGNNILNQWGLRKWGKVSAKGVRWKSYLILKKYQKPLHFRLITKYIKKHWPNKSKSPLPQTVHQILVKHADFSSVREGVYVLSEWIYPFQSLAWYMDDFLKKYGERQIFLMDVVKYISKKCSEREVLSGKKKVLLSVMAFLHQEKRFIRRNEKYMLK